ANENTYWQEQQNKVSNKLAQLKTENLLKNLVQNQKNLHSISAEMEQVESISKHSAENSSSSLSDVKTLIGDLNLVINKARQMRDSTQKLSDNSVQISEMVNIISSVADQTNLLALNAAIEAARAGEHGRGFAVVADEVKNLASSTKKAATEIGEIMSNFVNATHDMVSDTLEMSDMTEKSKSVIGQFEHNFELATTNSQQVYGKVSYVQVICQAALIKVDHLIYMQQTYRAVELIDPTPEDTASIKITEKQCRFGTWYESGLGKENYSHLPVYPTIKQPHFEVHDNMHRVMHILEQDWLRNLDLHNEMISAFRTAETASTFLTGLVDKMVEEKLQFEGFSDAEDTGEIELF
ncbi:MAG: CZB domain-containing protein, partial [Gammaproteobacteria bacterium]|nr:CZB domain-containing protein [Gammaproteobacteria bacterium]